jgi:hypothetical protein
MNFSPSLKLGASLQIRLPGAASSQSTACSTIILSNPYRLMECEARK